MSSAPPTFAVSAIAVHLADAGTWDSAFDEWNAASGRFINRLGIHTRRRSAAACGVSRGTGQGATAVLGGAQRGGHQRRARDHEAEREQTADDPDGTRADRLAEDKDRRPRSRRGWRPPR